MTSFFLIYRLLIERPIVDGIPPPRTRPKPGNKYKSDGDSPEPCDANFEAFCVQRKSTPRLDTPFPSTHGPSALHMLRQPVVIHVSKASAKFEEFQSQCEGTARHADVSYLDGELPLGEVNVALLGLLQRAGLVLGRQSATNGAGLLGAEVERGVLLVLVEQTKLRALLGVDDGQDTGDRLSQVVAAHAKFRQHFYRSLPWHDTAVTLSRSKCSHLGQLGARRNDLLDAELAQLSLELSELLRQIILALVPELNSLNLARRLQH